ncbi:MAG TPA: hypothetical protein VGQ16_07485 [Vicinamibacterales bacterium]|jgi:hypothetical protein|nr:hypothetical protein [Vicinamibacterales bacterium]
MKIVLKLLAAALIANAAFRVGQAHLTHYKFTDAVREMTQHRGTMTDLQVQDKVFELATQYSIPVTDQSLTITHEELNRRTIVKGSYIQPIDVVPGFTYNWPFSVDIETFILAPPDKPGGK